MLARADITRQGGVPVLPRRIARARRCCILSPATARTVLESFHFGRQTVERRTSASPTSRCRARCRRPDYVCLFATTVGPGVRALAEQWKDAGRVPALAHPADPGARRRRGVRRAAAPEDPRDVGLRRSAGHDACTDLFKVRYRGMRVSFGYPACPRLEDQEQLFRLLDVEKQHRRAAHRRLHDGARRLGERAGLPPPATRSTSASSPEDVERLERAIDQERAQGGTGRDLRRTPVAEAP